MKPSGAPDTGDLVLAITSFNHTCPMPGIILECYGVECFVLWANNTRDWRRRVLLRVISGD